MNKTIFFSKKLKRGMKIYTFQEEEFQTLAKYPNEFHESIKFTFERDSPNSTAHWLVYQITVG